MISEGHDADTDGFYQLRYIIYDSSATAISVTKTLMKMCFERRVFSKRLSWFTYFLRSFFSCYNQCSLLHQIRDGCALTSIERGLHFGCGVHIERKKSFIVVAIVKFIVDLMNSLYISHDDKYNVFSKSIPIIFYLI